MQPVTEDVDTLLEHLRAQVTDDVADFLEQQTSTVLAVSPYLMPLMEALEDLLRGGKRLRPTFAYWGWRAAGGDDSQHIVRACSSLEFLQACALIHDDVMDGSETRRGRPAAHRRLADMHRTRGYLGSAEVFGVGSAILLGDLCLSWSDEMLESSGLEAARVAAARTVFDVMRTELMAGQYLDLLAQAEGEYDPGVALTVAKFKSAKYTVERPLQMGAAAAGADQDLLGELSRFGIPVGEAFQLRDDILGVFGDPAQTGKPAGDDLREGKRTALVAVAWQSADATQRDLLRRYLGDPGIDARVVDSLRGVIRGTGALDAVESMIDDRVTAALEVLDRLQLDPVTDAALRRLVVLATRRRS